MNDLKQYRIKVLYHVNEEANMDGIYARSKEDAEAIAKIRFGKNFTERCIFDSMEIIEFNV